MTDIIKKETMTSLEIAEVTGKQHAHVMRDIRGLIESGCNESNFGLVDYKDKKGETRPMYRLTKKGCMILASGYDALLREKIIDRWEELENRFRKNEIVMPNFSNPAEAARAWADQYEQRLKLAAKVQEDAPKVEFFDSVAESKDAVEMKAVANTLNYVSVGRNKLFAILREQKILLSSNLPYQKYIDAGYFRTIETKKNCGSEIRIFIKTLVYQKGLDFIRKLLDKLGYRPKEGNKQGILEFKD